MNSVMIRCDASATMGGGHWIRCAALAAEFIRHGRGPVFVTRQNGGQPRLPLPAGCRLVELPRSLAMAEGYPWSEDDQRADAEACLAMMREFDVGAIVHDHYGLTQLWQERMSLGCAGAPLIALDDFPWRRHHCDVLVATSGSDDGEEFAALKPAEATYRGGPEYALLRPAFAKLRETVLARRAAGAAAGGVERLLVTMGATDAEGLTCDVLGALESMHFKGEVRVVLSGLSPLLARARAAVRRLPRATLVIDPADMAAEMAWADAAVGTAGQTSWERCVLGLPSLTVVVCDNQQRVGARLEEAGAAIVIAGPWPKREDYVSGLRVLAEPGRRRELTLASARLCDGRGASRIAGLLLRATISQ
jgi:UDP-2,4-diacetamido-2,4,6-trideoxy-beta-L-altropyranose hydrolase